MLSNLKSQISDSLRSSAGDVVRNHRRALWLVPLALVAAAIAIVRALW